MNIESQRAAMQPVVVMDHLKQSIRQVCNDAAPSSGLRSRLTLLGTRLTRQSHAVARPGHAHRRRSEAQDRYAAFQHMGNRGGPRWAARPH